MVESYLNKHFEEIAISYGARKKCHARSDEDKKAMSVLYKGRRSHTTELANTPATSEN